ncbi:hypothetical protein KCP70_06445 [Salmonella enterica subsp. enterica]|nr:hypothetical protein KCP70_06445 [Salmonella enterica subsp. enterica]
MLARIRALFAASASSCANGDCAGICYRLCGRRLATDGGRPYLKPTKRLPPGRCR